VIQTPDHSSLNGYDFDEVLRYVNTARSTAATQGVSLEAIYKPLYEAESTFHSFSKYNDVLLPCFAKDGSAPNFTLTGDATYGSILMAQPFPSNAHHPQRPFMAAVVDGSTEGNTFYYEAVGHFEIIGRQVATVTTKAPVDPVGLQQAQPALAKISPVRIGSSEKAQPSKTVGALTHLLNAGIDAATGNWVGAASQVIEGVADWFK
jgi:hypothetical protein